MEKLDFVDKILGNREVWEDGLKWKIYDQGVVIYVFVVFYFSLKEYNGVYFQDVYVVDFWIEIVKFWGISLVEVERFWKLSEK